MKPLTPSEDLAKVVGAKAIPRTEVVKKLWAYIKKNDLQDKKNRRNINADANLKIVFGGKFSREYDAKSAGRSSDHSQSFSQDSRSLRH